MRLRRAHKKGYAREMFIMGRFNKTDTSLYTHNFVSPCWVEHAAQHRAQACHRGLTDSGSPRTRVAPLPAQHLFSQQEYLRKQGRVWTPQLTASTRHCMRVLPWFGFQVPSTASP